MREEEIERRERDRQRERPVRWVWGTLREKTQVTESSLKEIGNEMRERGKREEREEKGCCDRNQIYC